MLTSAARASSGRYEHFSIGCVLLLMRQQERDVQSTRVVQQNRSCINILLSVPPIR
jgi:hypothetical protein